MIFRRLTYPIHSPVETAAERPVKGRCGEMTKSRDWKTMLLIAGATELGLRAADAIWYWGHNGAQLPHVLTVVSESPFQFWLSWCLGAKLADDYLQAKIYSGDRRGLVLLFSAAVTAAYFYKPAEVFTFPLAAAATYFLIECLISRPKAFSPSPQSAILSRIGLVSYSMYLIHVPLLWRALRLGRKYFELESPSSRFLLCLLSLPLIYIASLLSYRFIEKPSAGLGRTRRKISKEITLGLADKSQPVPVGE